ncbi:phytanoyl-CoA dioxygenase family protein [Pseudomonadales bacterium]|nr:phytanoyl-CoA dioxygenase family protein [Pseudomonadales bacterium]
MVRFILAKRLIAILCDSRFYLNNITIMPNSAIILSNILNDEELLKLEESYAEQYHDRPMPSSEVDKRYVFDNISTFRAVVLEKTKVSCILNAYKTKDNEACFVMRNEIVTVNGHTGSGGGWHRDSFNPTLKVFVPLTDCDEENGCTEYLLGTQSPWSKFKTIFQGLRISTVPNHIKQQVKLRRGDVAIVDASCIHRGRTPARAGRKMLTLYYKQAI